MTPRQATEETNMKSRIVTAALFSLALAPAAALADHEDEAVNGQDTAIQVCQDFNEYGPTEVLAAVEDGLGDYLVWLSDVDGDLWGCNASGEGDIYANVFVDFDLLDGQGMDMVQLVGGQVSRDPARQAERLCVAAAEDQVKVLSTVDDGLGDYLVWLKASDETFIMCNASSEGELWAFEYVGMPINDAAEIADTDEAHMDEPISAAPVRPGSPGQFG
jgi:hypothetical protein